MAGIVSIDINNGVMMRAQDMSAIKSNADSRPAVEQFDLQQLTEREHEENLTRVQDPNEIEREDFNFDARNKGSNEYEDLYGKKKKKKKGDENREGSFSLKNSSGSFDISI